MSGQGMTIPGLFGPVKVRPGLKVRLHKGDQLWDGMVEWVEEDTFIVQYLLFRGRVRIGAMRFFEGEDCDWQLTASTEP